MTEKQAMQIMGVLISTFPNNNVTEETIKIHVKFLLPMNFIEAQKAIYRIVQTARFFPTIAEIRENVEQFSPNQLPAPDMAWSEVMVQVQREGWCGKPRFTHPAIKQAVDAIGWRNICASETIGVERKHFMDIYRAVANRHKDEQINGQVLQMLGMGNELRLIK